jgi:hypothetical protein
MFYEKTGFNNIYSGFYQHNYRLSFHASENVILNLQPAILSVILILGIPHDRIKFTIGILRLAW